MSLSALRAMTMMFFLPLLFAHRAPIHVQPRASILRRMPMFYGKRDPALAAPSLPPSAPYPGAAYERSAAAPGQPYPVADRMDGPGFDVDAAIPGLDGRVGGRIPAKTSLRRFADDPGLPRRAGSLGPWNVPSILFQKLQSYIDSEHSGERFPYVARRVQGDRVRPQFMGIGDMWGPAENTRSASAGPYREAGTGYQGVEASLRTRMRKLSDAADYVRDQMGDSPYLHGENPGMIPLEWRSAMPDSESDQGGYNAMDTALDRLMSDERYDKDGGNNDASRIRRDYPRDENLNLW